MSEQLHTNSSRFSPVPINPSSLLMYSFSLASTTLVASMASNPRITVRRGSSMSPLMAAICWLVLSALNFRIRAIFISISLRMSSRLISRRKSFLNGSNLLSIWATASSIVRLSSNALSLYIRSSMKIFSRERKCNDSHSSPRCMRNSSCNRCKVRSVLRRKTSLTERNNGLLSHITQQLGEMLTSQSVKA